MCWPTWPSPVPAGEPGRPPRCGGGPGTADTRVPGRKRSCLPGSGRAGPGLYHGVGAGEDDRLVAVVVADEVRRPSVAASYLDDLDQMIALTDRAAMHAEPISHLCSHDPPPSAAARKTPPVGPATEVPGGDASMVIPDGEHPQ